MRIKKRYLFPLLASIVLSLAVPLIIGGLGQFALISRLSWGLALLLALMILLSLVFNAGRLRLLLLAMGKHLGMWDGLLLTMSAQFAGLATPGAVGMPVTYTFLFKRHVTLGQAMGLVAIVTLADILFYAALIPIAAVLLLTRRVPSATLNLVIIVLVLMAGFFLVMAILPRHYRTLCLFTGRRLSRFRWFRRRKYRMARSTVEFIRALRLLRQMSLIRQVGLYATTAGYWLLRLGVLIVIISMVGGSVPAAYLFLIQALLNMGGQVLFLPGGGGSVDAGYAALMSAYLAPQMIGFTLIIWRAYTYYLYLILGGPVFVFKTGEAAQELLNKSSGP